MAQAMQNTRVSGVSGCRYVLPGDWYYWLYVAANLKECFSRLQEYASLHAEVLRGFIKLCFNDMPAARKHFSRAEAMFENIPREELNNTQIDFDFTRRLCEIHCFLLEHSPGTIRPGNMPSMDLISLGPQFSGAPVETYYHHHEFYLGMAALYTGDNTRARDIFGMMVVPTKYCREDDHAMQHLGLAAALHNLGESQQALQHLKMARELVDTDLAKRRQLSETGEIDIGLLPRKFRKLSVAIILRAFYAFLEDRRAAEEAHRFLKSIECEPYTKYKFFNRSVTIGSYCTGANRLLIV